VAAGVLDALRPKPFRGDVLAAGVVVLTTLVTLLHLRFNDDWGSGVHLVYGGLALAFVAALAVQSPPEGPSPRAYQSVLYLASIALAFLVLIDLADILGADEPLGAAGTLVWVFGSVAAIAFWFAVTRNSAVCTLVGSVAGGAAVLAFVDWVFDPSGAQTFRWVLFLLLAVFTLCAVAQRDRRPRHGVALVNAAGLASFAIGWTLAPAILFLAIDSLGEGGGPWGWELVLLAVGWGLLAFASVEREPGPAYLGVLNLLSYVLLASVPGRDGPTLLGWPLFLAAAALVLLVVGLRPTTPAPPAPDEGRPPAPTRPFGAQ
jgi:predicted membrane channel-forming protein YqfA (hemolysin III family)